MNELETALRIATEYGLGIVLSVFMAFSFIVLGKKLITGHQHHEEQLVSIIKEREEGIVDNMSDMTKAFRGLSTRIQQMSEQIDYLQEKLNNIERSQDDISRFFED